MKKIVYFIMAGGKGMRLWPMSRAHFPKQLHALLGNSSFLQQSVKRVLKISRPENILISTQEDLYFSIKDQWQGLRLKSKPWLILEPLSRNTAPAIALAILAVRERFGDDVILVTLASDHVIKKQKRFKELVEAAVKIAQKGDIVTFGIIPTYPETGYGYIKTGRKIGRNIFKITQFKEKPTLELAGKYLKSRNYLWNSGMFIFDTKVLADNLERFAPSVWKQAKIVWAKRKKKNDSASFPKSAFGKLPNISIDYAVMEKASRRSVVKADFGWCDVGCWRMVHQLSNKDKNGNVFSGNICSLDTKNSFIRAEKRFVAAVGLEDIIVIDTPDALLISKKERSQDVKRIVEKLDAQKSLLTKFHTTVYRPWGNYTVLEQGPGYKIKRVVVKPRQQLSLQKHRFRSEHWVVISGKARIINKNDAILLKANESIFIPKGCIHRIINSFRQEVVIIEVQTGNPINEEDIVRFDDVYERN